MGVGIVAFTPEPQLLVMPWMWIKFACIIMMTLAHMIFHEMRRQLEQNIALSEKAYRLWNEVSQF